MPQVGKVEPLLSHLPKIYRSVVVSSHNKMVYSVADDSITIHDFGTHAVSQSLLPIVLNEYSL